MPKEQRKRGKKHRKNAELEAGSEQQLEIDGEEAAEFSKTPSWVVRPLESETADSDPAAPYGYVDTDVKAYFRTVDLQMRDWAEQPVRVQDDGYDDPNMERRLFLVAALTEMSGKEKQLATDPECSVVLERMAHSMDDFVKRVFLDKLAGSFETLFKHRFASHVCQTLFTISVDTIDRECRGISPDVPAGTDQGELFPLCDLIKGICNEISPAFCDLIQGPYGSHVIRALLCLLHPPVRHLAESTTDSPGQSSSRPSKKHASWKARQGVMKSVLREVHVQESIEMRSQKRVPEDFSVIAKQFLFIVRQNLGENEIRALAIDQVASPVLRLLLEIEADFMLSDEPGSIMDKVLDSVITTTLRAEDGACLRPSDYVSALFRDATSSHLLETLISRSSGPVFAVIWSGYIHRKLSRLALHPVANFVVARALEKATPSQLQEALDELSPHWTKMIENGRTGVMLAAVNRVQSLQTLEETMTQVVLDAFDLVDAERRTTLVSCALRLKSFKEYTLSSDALNTEEHEREVPATTLNRRRGHGDDPVAPKIQGALLLQALLRLSEPHNRVVTDSVQSLSQDDVISLAHNAISSRILDALLESPTIPHKVKRNFVLSLIGKYHTLADDRIGSRVADRCWAFADPYLKEKIVRSLIQHEQFLVGSQYGKYFVRKVNIRLFQHNIGQWKELQIKRRDSGEGEVLVREAESTSTSTSVSVPPKKRKRTNRMKDEIDAVFSAVRRKTRPAMTLLSVPSSEAKIDSREYDTSHSMKIVSEQDVGLQEVMGAIHAAPDQTKGHSKKKR